TRRHRPAHRGRRPWRARQVRAGPGRGRRADRRDRRAGRPRAHHGRGGYHRARPAAGRDSSGVTRVTGASGIIGDGMPTPDEAAGDSPTSGAKTGHGRRGWRAAFFALAAVGVVGAAAWVLFGSPLLVVRSVTVSGTHLVPRSEVLAASGVVPGTPLIRVNAARAAARIEQITQVRSVQVSRSWPNRLVIVVREPTPVRVMASYG